MVDEVIRALRARFGTNWADDEEANLRFTIDAEQLIRDVEGAHLIGDPEIVDGSLTLRVWVDHPIRDLMTADQLAYEIFGRLSEDLFYTERRFRGKEVHYPFVTGSASHGHIGALVLAGPHAADFADRHQTRMSGGLGYQA
jgi:hypothetical protein